jgi:hypothetical protein
VPITYANSQLSTYGAFDHSKLLYHFEWHPTSSNTSYNATYALNPHVAFQAGQTGMLSQYENRLEIMNSTPVFLSPGGAGSLGNGRYGPFAPGAEAYVLRARASLTGNSALPYSDGWKLSATVPFSFEVACGGNQPHLDNTPRGLFVEAFNRKGLNTIGVNAFAGQDGRHYYGALAQHQLGQLTFEGGIADVTGPSFQTHVASLGTEWTPTWEKAIGFRMDDQDGIYNYVPSVSYLIGGERGVIRLLAETNMTKGVGPTTTFSVSLKF